MDAKFEISESNYLLWNRNSENGWPGDVRAGPKCHEEVSSPSVPRRDMGGGIKLFLIIWLAAYRQLRLPRLTMDLESANSFNYTGGSADLMIALTIPEARHLIVGQDQPVSHITIAGDSATFAVGHSWRLPSLRFASGLVDVTVTFGLGSSSSLSASPSSLPSHPALLCLLLRGMCVFGSSLPNSILRRFSPSSHRTVSLW